MVLESGARLDRYIVERVIGEGGMAVVYRARHVHLGTPVALKVLAVPLVAVQQRLLLEGRAQAALRHPNIVAVYDVVDVRGAPGLVMELVEGPTLAELLSERRLELDQVDELARGILDGVAAAHRFGIVHRDLKPGNVLLELRPGGVVPKVTDFGLAKALVGQGGGASSDSESGAPVGTPAYMSPEQLTDPRGVDARADVFALGALLYEMLTGRQAFDGAHVLEIYTAIHAGRYTPIEALVPGVPERMRRAVEAALVVDRERRVASVDALRELWTGGQDADAGGSVSGVRWGAVLREAGAMGRRPRAVPTPTRRTEEEPTIARSERFTEALRGAASGWPAERMPPATRRAWTAVAAFALAVAGVGAWVVSGGGGSGGSGEALAVAAGEPASDAARGPTEPTATEPVAAEPPVAEPPVAPAGAAPVEAPPVAVGGGSTTVPEAAPPSLARRDPPSPAPASPAPASPAPASPASALAAPPAPEPVAPDGLDQPPGPPTPMARLIVNSRPWSDRIVVDGSIPAGLKAPLELTAGTHEVTLRAHDGRTASQRIELRPDQTLVFCWDFDAQSPCGR